MNHISVIVLFIFEIHFYWFHALLEEAQSEDTNARSILLTVNPGNKLVKYRSVPKAARKCHWQVDSLKALPNFVSALEHQIIRILYLKLK